MSAMLILAASRTDAQGHPAGTGPRNNFPSHHGGNMHELNSGIFVVEREVPVIVEKEVVRDEKPAEPPVAVTPPEPRKPYVIGSTYASLPAGCMKMIDGGATYYYCDGGWYRPVSNGGVVEYKAVAAP